MKKLLLKSLGFLLLTQINFSQNIDPINLESKISINQNQSSKEMAMQYLEKKYRPVHLFVLNLIFNIVIFLCDLINKEKNTDNLEYLKDIAKLKVIIAIVILFGLSFLSLKALSIFLFNEKFSDNIQEDLMITLLSIPINIVLIIIFALLKSKTV